MRRVVLPIVAMGLLLGQKAAADEVTRQDSAASFPARVHHRSSLEWAATVPGRLVYLPLQVTGYGTRRIVALLWDERILYRARELLTFADGRVGVRPLANSRRGAGTRVFVNDVAGMDVNFTSTFGASGSSRQHQQLSLTGWGDRTISAYYRSEPKESFYGIGHDARESDKSSFRRKDIYLQVTSQRALSDRVSLDWDINYHRTEIEAGESKSAPSTTDVYPPGTLPGLEDKIVFVEAGFTIRGLFVDVPGSPTRGNRTRLRFAHRQSVDDDEFSHVQVGIHTEQFMELFYRRTVSLQLGADWRFDPYDNDIPFYHLASLGGTEILRGFKRGRFRDNGVGYAVGTYKFPVWELIEGTLFYESGRAFHQVSDLSLSDWESSYGGGIRLWVPDGVVFELLVAKSSEMTRLLFSLATNF